MDEIVKDFLIESNENLDRLDQELVKLESEPSSKELLASIFRTIHTIKGSCGFLGFARLEKLAHAGESLLSRLRDGKLTLNCRDHQRLAGDGGCGSHMLAAIQASGQDGEEDYAPLIELLRVCRERRISQPTPSAQAAETRAPRRSQSQPQPVGFAATSEATQEPASEEIHPAPAKIDEVHSAVRTDSDPSDLARASELQEEEPRKHR